MQGTKSQSNSAFMSCQFGFAQGWRGSDEVTTRRFPVAPTCWPHRCARWVTASGNGRRERQIQEASRFPNAKIMRLKPALQPAKRRRFSYRCYFSGEGGVPVKRSRSLRTRQIAAPSSLYLAGSVSFIISRKSWPSRMFNSAGRSGIDVLPREAWRNYISTSARNAVTEITTNWRNIARCV